MQQSYHPKPPTKQLASFIVAHSAVLYDLLQLVLNEILCLPKKMKLQVRPPKLTVGCSQSS